MPRNYVKVAEKTKKDAKEDKSLGRISAFFSKTAANGSGVCHRLHRLPSNRFLCGEFIAGAFDSAASTEEATPAQASSKRAVPKILLSDRDITQEEAGETGGILFCAGRVVRASPVASQL